MFNRKKDFVITAQRVFSTSDGLTLLKYFEEDFLNRSVREATVEDTYYRIGQQDFVKRLIKTLKEPDNLEDVSTIPYETEEEQS